MLKKLLLLAGAVVGGIYLTSEEGKNARESLLKKKSAFEPIVNDLIKQSGEILEGSKSINSDEVRANIDMLVHEAKQTLVNLDLDKAAETIKEAIRVASKKIRIAMNETEKELALEGKKSPIKKVAATKKTAAKKVSTKKTTAKKPVTKKAATKKPVKKTTTSKETKSKKTK